MKYRLIAILAALLTLVACSCQNSNEKHELVILHTNDTHSHIEPVRGGDSDAMAGVIERAAYIDSVRAAVGADNLLLVDAGDFSQGSSYFTILGGDLEVEVMNAMGYDVSALGNHEFDNGPAELARRIGMAKYKVVCANYDFTGSPLEGVVSPWTIVNKAGRKIGIIGLLTDVTRVVDASIAATMKYQEPAPVVASYAKELREKGCDLVLVLSHLGYKEDLAMVPQISGVDIVIGGHSHTFIEAPAYVEDLDGKSVPVVQDGCWGITVGKIVVK